MKTILNDEGIEERIVEMVYNGLASFRIAIMLISLETVPKYNYEKWFQFVWYFSHGDYKYTEREQLM